jgi:hypothetical protein
MVLQYYAFYLYYVRKALLKLCEDASPPLLRNQCLHTFLTTLSQPPNIVALLLHP